MTSAVNKVEKYLWWSSLLFQFQESSYSKSATLLKRISFADILQWFIQKDLFRRYFAMIYPEAQNSNFVEHLLMAVSESFKI